VVEERTRRAEAEIMAKVRTGATMIILVEVEVVAEVEVIQLTITIETEDPPKGQNTTQSPQTPQ